ncbi:polysaccharide deacetylase family protein [Paenibacillus harenae]|uniref:Peptidoglycan/xylan/chitin deacetylase (PgdA/CDA1 family) n=1 Tax=Paenibacillus harenae TaxID=306543 RepID=A0ABT9U5X9_PAEHA|nr:polysaccharide deacetylase family protein [Paenibacillus harenae]MDQ0063234.1 peptidoglycan/xylan/chitin deacetylase (PgdA/CDA1 family) [Paenibacillus harenae]MDQ0114978.1 peptidoglycan/xylan/chitin deacetylase (PgdA/CDA1 family) [Paenibacillus harenae]
MARRMKRYRGWLVMVLLAAVMVWTSGCAVSQTLDLTANAVDGDEQETDEIYSDLGLDLGGAQDEADSGVKPGEVILVQDGGDDDLSGNVVPIEIVPEGPAESVEQKVIALTFDDGPDKRYTPAILDILKEKGVKATFFVVGLQVSKSPEVLERIVKEGHEIGNHTYNHKDLSKLGKDAILKEINAGDKVIKEAVGFTPMLFRAPYGAVSDTLKEILEKTGRHMIGWNIDTRDWAGTSVADMQEMIRTEAKPGGIILMHSFGGKHIAHTVEALPGIIDDLTDMGYSFAGIDELH